MSGINNCETLEKARAIARASGMNPKLVACPGCNEGTDCRFAPTNTEELPEDYAQRVYLTAAEGQANLAKFYRRLEKHFQLQAPKSSGAAPHKKHNCKNPYSLTANQVLVENCLETSTYLLECMKPRLYENNQRRRLRIFNSAQLRLTRSFKVSKMMAYARSGASSQSK